MLHMSWSTFRERWPVFVGAIVTVTLGVALVQSSLLILISAATARIPVDLAEAEQRALREAYEAAISLLGIVLGLASFVAMFIVSSTFAFTVAQRRRDLALLRLTGASRRQVRSLVLGEALLLGTVGSALGVLVGLPVMRLQIWMLTEFGFLPAGFTAGWRSWILAVSMGTGVTIAVCGVLAASGRATRVRPLEALREISTAARVMTVSRWIVGAIFLAGGTAMAILVPALGGEAALALSALVSMVLVIAFAALAPLIVPLVSWPLRLVTAGQISQLAYANLRTGVRRSASTAAPIMVLVAFVAGLAGSLDTVGEASRQELVRTLRGDLVVTSNRSVTADLAAVDGVATVSEEVPVSLEVPIDDGDGDVSYDSVDALAVDPAAYLRTHEVALGSGDLAELRGDSVAVSSGSLPGLDYQVGDTLLVRFGDQARELRVVALLPATIVGPYALLPLDFTAEYSSPRTHTVELAPDADPSAVLGQLAPYGEALTVPEWIRRHADEQERQSLNVGVALLGLAMLYTVLAMINAVVISTSARRVEFATARVTGLTRGQVVRMALGESMAVVVIGLLLGGLAAATTVLGIASAIDDLTGIRVVAIRWPLLGALAMGATVVVGVTSLITTLAATRTPAIRLAGARE